MRSMLPHNHSAPRGALFLDAAVIVLIVGSVICLARGISIPILELHKRVEVRLLGLTIPILNQENNVTILGAISDLFGSHSIALGTIILAASIVLPAGKNLVIAGVWVMSRRRRRTSAHLMRVLCTASKYSLTEPFAIGLTIVALKLGSELRVTLGPDCTYFLTSIFASIAATELVRRYVIPSANQ